MKTLGLVWVLGLTWPGLLLAALKVPAGFTVSIYAQGLDSARAMAVGDRGTLFVGSRSPGVVYAVRDRDGDGVADTTLTVATGLEIPLGVAFKDGDLYVSAVSKIYRLKDIENHLKNPPDAEVVYDQYPSESYHGGRYIRFDPQGKLTVPVGSPCNVCKRKGVFGTLTRLDIASKQREVIAHGIRDSVGFDWDAQGRLWFSDNGRDMMGDDMPADELNRIDASNPDFGFPYCHGGDVLDPEFGKGNDCAQFTAPQVRLGAHTAPLGMSFYRGQSFPQAYRGDLFVAEHGSWNRSKKVGYRVLRIKIKNGKVVGREPFLSGFLDRLDAEGATVQIEYPSELADWHWGLVDKEVVHGRPVDVINSGDGALLVSDDYAGKIYKVSYLGEKK